MEQRTRRQRFSDMPEPELLDTSEALPARELTWQRIISEEPSILDVLAALEKATGDSEYSRWHAYVEKHGTTPKAALSKMVGWGARNPALRSQRAYEMVMDAMWDLIL
jgi:hypothetical protein